MHTMCYTDPDAPVIKMVLPTYSIEKELESLSVIMMLTEVSAMHVQSYINVYLRENLMQMGC